MDPTTGYPARHFGDWKHPRFVTILRLERIMDFSFFNVTRNERGLYFSNIRRGLDDNEAVCELAKYLSSEDVFKAMQYLNRISTRCPAHGPTDADMAVSKDSTLICYLRHTYPDSFEPVVEDEIDRLYREATEEMERTYDSRGNLRN